MTLIEYLKTSNIVESDVSIGKKFGVTGDRVSYIRIKNIGKKKKIFMPRIIPNYKIAKALQDHVGGELSIRQAAENNKISYEQLSKFISTHWIGKRKFTENSKYITLKSKV